MGSLGAFENGTWVPVIFDGLNTRWTHRLDLEVGYFGYFRSEAFLSPTKGNGNWYLKPWSIWEAFGQTQSVKMCKVWYPLVN